MSAFAISPFLGGGTFFSLGLRLGKRGRRTVTQLIKPPKRKPEEEGNREAAAAEAEAVRHSPVERPEVGRDTTWCWGSAAIALQEHRAATDTGTAGTASSV